MAINYKTFNGEQFFTSGFVFSKDRAKYYAELDKRRVKELYPQFNFKYKLVRIRSKDKSQDGYIIYQNNTVRNMKDL